MPMPSFFGPRPTTDQPNPDKTLSQRLERRVGLSRLALAGERIWETLLWPFLVGGTFLIVSLLELWSLLPPLAHRIVLIGFAIALVISLLPLIRMPWPTRAEALRRLERKANVKHRPASSYEDTLSGTASGETAALWAAHRERLANLVARLKPAWPAPRTDRKDPYAIRSAVLLALVVALLVGGADFSQRLRAAFAPRPIVPASLLRIDAWVTPPVYTGVAPIVLADGTEAIGVGAESFRALSVPERSELTVRAHAPEGQTVSLITAKEDGSDPTVVTPKKSGNEDLVTFDTPLNAPGTADVEIGGSTVAKWRFALIKDNPPQISLMGDPTATPRGALRLVFHADDDHGVASAEARFALAEGQIAGSQAPSDQPSADQPSAPGGDAAHDPLMQPPVMPLQLPHANAKQIDGKSTQDLTAHPWAGLKVKMTLIAHDQAGQTGSSQPYEFVLPERQFTKPLARAVVEQRKKLIRDPDSPDMVARALDALTVGGDRVINDSSVYLSLRNAYWRLQTDQSHPSVVSVIDQLWEVALRIEDGDLPRAERDVKQAQDQLSKAIQQNASPEEIQRLVDQLRQALSKYLQSLAQQQQEKNNLSPQNAEKGDDLVSQQDLDKMLKNIQQLANSGSKDMAQQMLAELKDILDRLQTNNSPETAKQQRANKMMKDLSQLVDKQQKLLDDTFAARRQQGGNQRDQFEVSPPGQPMDWGEGLNMAPMFEAPGQQEGQEGEGAQDRQTNQDQQQSQQQGHGKRGAPGKGSSQFGDLGQRQGDLGDQLQTLIDRFRMEGGDAPDQFKDARQAMGDAKQSIGQKNLDRATQQQSLALERLRQGAQSMAEQTQTGETQADRGPGNNGRDPLGRPDRSNRPDLGLSVKVPDEIDVQRAREVFDEVRRRLSDPSRPPLELDYLDRLIKPY